MNKQELNEAIIDGNKRKILEILKRDVDVKASDEKGNTLMHLAFKNTESSQDQLIDILRIFLDRGIDINAKNKLGTTVLQLAVERRMRDVIDFCLRRNAHPNLKHKRRNSIAHFAIEEECRKFHSPANNENLEMAEQESSSFVDWMVTRGIDFFYTRNIDDYSALYLAVNLNLHHIVLALLKRLDDLPEAERRQTPLLCAFLESNDNSEAHFNPKTLTSIRSSGYEFRHVYDIVKIILEKNRSIHYGTLKESLLSSIKSQQKLNVIEMLLRRTTYDDKTLNEALRSAIRSNLGIDLIKMLLQRTTREDESLNDALSTAIQSGKRMDVVELLLERITSVKNRRTHSASIIQTFANNFSEWTRHSSEKDDMEILRTLIRKGADVNERDCSGETVARKMFRRYPKLELLELLKQSGADFDLWTISDESVLHLVSLLGREAGMIRLVAKKGCDVNIANSKGETPLQVAMSHKSGYAARELIERGAKVDVVYKDGSTPISVACVMGQTHTVERMIDYGASLEYKNRNGKSLLHLVPHNSLLVELLLRKGANVNAKDKAGRTPIHSASSAAVVRLLLDAGARVDALDENGKTPLYCALLRKDFATSVELLKYGADVRDPKVFQLALDHFRRPYDGNYPDYRFLKRHLVRLIAAGLLAETIYAQDGIEKTLQPFFEECQGEVELLKSFLVDDGISLYEVLRKNRNRRCDYVDKERLKSLVDDSAIREKFPIYDVVILGYYNEAVKRKSLLATASCVLKHLNGMKLPDSCVDQILVYLSNVDLARFVAMHVKIEK